MNILGSLITSRIDTMCANCFICLARVSRLIEMGLNDPRLLDEALLPDKGE